MRNPSNFGAPNGSLGGGARGASNLATRTRGYDSRRALPGRVLRPTSHAIGYQSGTITKNGLLRSSPPPRSKCEASSRLTERGSYPIVAGDQGSCRLALDPYARREGSAVFAGALRPTNVRRGARTAPAGRLGFPPPRGRPAQRHCRQEQAIRPSPDANFPRQELGRPDSLSTNRFCVEAGCPGTHRASGPPTHASCRWSCFLRRW